MLSRNSWHGQRLMTAVQWLRLQAALDHINLADGQQVRDTVAVNRCERIGVEKGRLRLVAFREKWMRGWLAPPAGAYRIAACPRLAPRVPHGIALHEHLRPGCFRSHIVLFLWNLVVPSFLPRFSAPLLPMLGRPIVR